MKPDTLQEQPPKPYSISAEEFRTPPKKLVEYIPGERVTRENFNSFLIQSFAVSMGQQEVQIHFMEWVRLKTGFNYPATLASFYKAGDWDVLSENERKEFRNKFSKVPTHKEKIMESKWEDKIREEIQTFSSLIFQAKKQTSEEIRNILLKLKTFKDFLMFTQETVERLREEQRNFQERKPS